MKSWITQHITGLTGQVSAVLPLLLVTIVTARSSGLADAGLFTVVVGISAAAFTVSLWGMRTAIIRDRFRTVSPLNYVTARLLAVSVAGVVVTLSGVWLQLDPALLVTIILYRVSDAILDLDFAFDQVRRETAAAIRSYANLQMARLGILLSLLAVATLVPAMQPHGVYLVSAIAALAIAVRALARSLAAFSGYPDSPHLEQLGSAFRSALWYALAAAACAILTSAPRISLPLLYDGDDMGVIGVSLSVTTFFGMAFYTTWVRYLPRFVDQDDGRSPALAFLGETALIAVLAGLVSLWPLPQIVAAVFGFSDAAQIDQCRLVLLTSVVFFAGMCTVNLFKVTSQTWAEMLAYLSALVVTAQIALSIAAARQMPTLLLIAGIVMLALGFMALRLLNSEAADRDDD